MMAMLAVLAALAIAAPAINMQTVKTMCEGEIDQYCSTQEMDSDEDLVMCLKRSKYGLSLQCVRESGIYGSS